jgi:GNAT superfamily N-acetyltransferase
MARLATRHDLTACKTLLRAYADELGIAALRQHNELHVERLFGEMFAGRGFVLIDEQARGLLAAMVVRNFWNPELLELHEICFYVQPEARKRTIGGKLWLLFNKLAGEMLTQGRVQMVVCSRNQGLAIERYSYKQLHTLMVRECQQA